MSALDPPLDEATLDRFEDAARRELALAPGHVQQLIGEIRRLRQEAIRLQDAVDLERRLKVAARRDAEELGA